MLCNHSNYTLFYSVSLWWTLSTIHKKYSLTILQYKNLYKGSKHIFTTDIFGDNSGETPKAFRRMKYRYNL